LKHVAFLIPTIDRLGGAEKQVISLAGGLAKRGWKTTVIALSGIGGDGAGQLRAAEVHFFSLGMRKGLADPRGWVRLHYWMRKNQPDVIHAHLPHAALLARWSRIGSPVRALLDTVHSPATGGTTRRLGYQRSNALPDVVTAVSRTAAEAWLATGAIDEANLVIIPNGVDLDRFRPDNGVRAVVRSELGVSHEFLWIAVGRLDPVKDHATMLRAFGMLSGNARLIVAGDGPLRGQLNSLAKELDLQGRVRILGFERDVLRWLRAADGFVLCSRWEGLPIALIEASACELPSVVTDIAGAREVLPDSPSCLSVPVGNPDALAASMRHMMSLAVPELRDRGQCARNVVAARFALDMVLDCWEALYAEVLAANPHPRRFGNASSSPGRTFQLQ
jgi:glycosyltransferase involved in cell wall biosynthesis